ncbi:MAG TPA: hypothetical protein DCZ94_04325 [Lentisphaeria bacterium]|nr:MAG: hypothetical protein A2X48_05545 [Lentisphaerae bacterium GWF2_49_21]HBC86162.1 hypothetical protein [Lentisphaeria bacterium]
MRCFFCENIGGTNTLVQLPEREERHLFNTLRGRTGDTVQLVNGEGLIATARVAEGRKLFVLEVDKFEEPARKIHLFVSPPKHNKMDQLLTQCCEIGVWSITFIIMEHSVVRPDEGDVSEKWNIHLMEGCKQSKNPFMPELGNVISFSTMVDDIGRRKLQAFYGAVKGELPDDPEGKPGSELAWIVGPEGGFSQPEEDRMRAARFIPFNIGRWVMRTETAAVAGAALLMGR